MAKYRHRIFEMYDFRDEATRALTPKQLRQVMEDTTSELTFELLTVSRSESVMHVQFKKTQTLREETVNDLREDFLQLANRLGKDSKVLVDFAGVKSFCASSIDELELFNRQLRIKGSRIALCCLDSTVKQSFFQMEQRK